ncbi:MAG TPA: polysaccharide biosynthesis/export family protein [Terriglobales bacterium]|nr:polysaccharide biosynthesis/export family protein [Terriglobales bacterium]
MKLSFTKISKHVLLVAVLAVPALIYAQDTAAPDSKTQAVNVASLDKPVPAPEGKPHDNSFVIGINDMLAINVWKEPDVSRSVPVRSDGKISLPLAGELQAAGLTPLKLEQDIASKLQNFISEPEVTVIVQQINSQKFNILGFVNRPGSYALGNTSTVLDAIAVAGGFRDFAKQKSIYVLRQNQDGTQAKLPFNYKDVIKGKNASENVKLQPNDTIVVP